MASAQPALPRKNFDPMVATAMLQRMPGENDRTYYERIAAYVNRLGGTAMPYNASKPVQTQALAAMYNVLRVNPTIPPVRSSPYAAGPAEEGDELYRGGRRKTHRRSKRKTLRRRKTLRK